MKDIVALRLLVSGAPLGNVLASTALSNGHCDEYKLQDDQFIGHPRADRLLLLRRLPDRENRGTGAPS
jgi:hypothetical protein